MEVLCICGQWISKESLQWEFLVDLKRNASIISIEEDLLYEDLMKIVSEDFSVKEEEISLSYGFSLDKKCIIESFPPLSIGNTRQLRTFISKTRAFDGTCRLCVKVCMIFFLLRLFRICFITKYYALQNYLTFAG